MAVPVIMPRQGLSVESCIITKWHKKKGDRVEPGDLLFTYETDKATFEEESQHSGILLDIFFEEGDDVPVLTNVCVIGEEGEDTSIYTPHKDETNQVEDDKVIQEPSQQHFLAELEADPETPIKVTQDQEDDIIKISPRARNLAKKAGVNILDATPTGPEGRIIERDIIELIHRGQVLTPAAMEAYRLGDFHLPAEGTGLGGRITTYDLELVANSSVETEDSIKKE